MARELFIPLLVVLLVFSWSQSLEEPVYSPTLLAEEEIEEEEEEEPFSFEGRYFSPFSGLPLNEEQMVRKPIIATIENSPQSRPQSGLAEADLIYEFPVEGGITRFLALYHSRYPRRAGPIRSARPYLLQTALQYRALYLHIGASPRGFELLEEIDLNNLDQLGAYGRHYYWRSLERSAPYNLYTDPSRLSLLYEERNLLNKESYFSFQHLSIILEEEQEQCHQLVIPYWGGYKVEYQYQPEAGNYLRLMDGEPHQTEQGQRLKPENILVKFARVAPYDDQGRLQIDLLSSGPLLLFRDGMVFEGQWIREGEETNYYDREGEELLLNAGQSFIQVVPLSTQVEY